MKNEVFFYHIFNFNISICFYIYIGSTENDKKIEEQYTNNDKQERNIASTILRKPRYWLVLYHFQK